ncbi:voltage-dependent anion channel [Pelagophyceae sp. CCMP2097]|nr:voltage-dependent anion channel [Pelagophyceae sp. CCMP2097]|mmetsp:Transcript_17509/g.62256  ORF Transcript_17509/g.62256 Transcript_17509/m.62256 type:complete len:371 (+) Transcript_17509:213-1325(+)
MVGLAWYVLPNTAAGIALGLAGHAVVWSAVSSKAFCGQSHYCDVQIAKLAQNAFWVSALVVWVGFLLSTFAKFATAREYALREWRHATRAYFYFAPLIVLILLCLGMPPALKRKTLSLRTALFSICLASQLIMASVVYARWLRPPKSEKKTNQLGSAKPPFLLSTIGWPLLTLLAQQVHFERRFGVDVGSMTLGAGVALYALAFVSIFQASVESEPALFLLIAPPCAIALAIAGYGGFGPAPKALLGFALALLAVFAKLGPTLLGAPSVLGVYWAYVFPLAALATAAVRAAEFDDSRGSRGLAWTLVALATATLILVAARMAAHCRAVAGGQKRWADPLLEDSRRQGPEATKAGDDDLELSKREHISRDT